MKQLRFATFLFAALLAGAGGLMPLPCEAASWPGFERGMGIGGWLTNYKRFNVLPEERRLQLTQGDLEHFDSYITEADVARIKGWGFDHVRLGFDQILLEESPGKYRERTFRKVDEFIGWCGKHRMNVVLNLHKAVGNYCDIKENVELLDDDGLQRRFIDLWLEIERRYHDFPGLAFEILNEVRDVDPEKWNNFADRAVKAIRAMNAERWIIVGSTCWNSPSKLKVLKVWNDPTVVYTFHMYAPFEFTHQRGVLQPEPLYCNMVLEYPSDDVECYRNCRRLGWCAENPYPNAKAIDKTLLADNLRGAFEFVKAHPDKILWNGEFGTIRHAPLASRVAYMRDVVSICREHGIPYCVWNYLSTPNDGNRFSLVDDDTREFLSQELLNACLGTSRMSATGDYRLPEDVYVVSEVPGYNSWPMIQAVGNRLICSYSRDNARPKDGHKINRGSRDSYLRISLDAGRTWSEEITVADDPIIGEVNEGIGLDETGAAILWVRCWGKDRRHELYRTVDGQTIEKIATVRPDPFPMQIMDPVRVKGLGLVSPWFAGNYSNGGSNSWGLLVSTDNGRTWSQRIIEKDLSIKEWVTEPSLVDLGGGRLLIVGRCEKRLGNQFQVTSTDGGKTWKKARTNISDVRESTPSLVYDAKSGIVANYYYHRGAKQLKRRVAMADFIFDHPDCWPEPEVLDEGFEQRSYDAGNLKATRLGDMDCCAWYTGTPSNATVVVTVAASAVKAQTGACPGFEHGMGIGGKEDGLNFQGLIDEAAAHGGGRVVVPAGRHETGPLHLRSNVELHLEDGAELLFTDDIEAYLPAVETCRGGVECLCYSPLIYANGATNIAITGRGTLRPRMGLWECWQWGGTSAKQSRSVLFETWGENDVPLENRDLTKLPDSKARPQFIGLRRCKGVRLEDFRIRHSPSWCVHLLECDGVAVRRIDVEAYMHNNDGIDIESSRNVLVEDSRFSVGDDIICLKSGRDRDGRRRALPTENVVVRRCVADCGHAFFGIGSELSGGIRNAVMEDCVMDGTCAWLFRIKTTPTRGGFVENVAMRRVKAKTITASALNITYGYNSGAGAKDVSVVPPTVISGVTLEDVKVERAERAIEIEGDGRRPVKGVSLNRFAVERCLKPDVVKNADVLRSPDIQHLIDEAAANGGGRVVVPAGRHLVGQIDLRSNVELYLEKGAVLEGKVGLENYRVTTLPYSENYGDRPCAWRRETAGTSPAR